VEYRFILADFIKSCVDFKYSLLSKYKNWSKSTKIETKFLLSLRSIFSLAYALDEKAERNAEKMKLLILIQSNQAF
jgi:hypothetical protein